MLGGTRDARPSILVTMVRTLAGSVQARAGDDLVSRLHRCNFRAAVPGGAGTWMRLKGSARRGSRQ